MRVMVRPAARRLRDGFTLVEALVSITIATVASSALFLGTASSIRLTEASLEQTIAQGIAEQLADEVLGTMYSEPGAGAYETSLGPSAYEAAGVARELYNDTDDFHAYVKQPPVCPRGGVLGTEDSTGSLRHAAFRDPTGLTSRWEERISVYYVSNTDPSVQLTGTQTSNLRAVEVTVSEVDSRGLRREIAKVRRVYGNIPTP